MNRSKRLERVASLTRMKEDAAVRRLRDARQTLAKHESRQDQLQNYRNEYECRRPEEGAHVSLVMNYRVFCSNLSGAIEHQSRLCEEETQRVSAALQEWQDRRHRTQALENAVEKTRGRERMVTDRIQAAVIDDMVNSRNIDRS